MITLRTEKLFYLRPDPNSAKVNMIDSLETGAIVIDHRESIAMFTSRYPPNRGPIGLTGETGIQGPQ